MNLQVEGCGSWNDRVYLELNHDDVFMIYKRSDGEGHRVIVKAGDRYFHIPKVIRIECTAVYDERGVMYEVCTEELWEQYKRQKELDEPKDGSDTMG